VKPEFQPKLNDYWTNDSITKLDEVLQNLGDELDSIMVSILEIYINFTST